MNLSFPHLNNAIKFVQSEFQLDEEQAMEYIMVNFREQDNQMIVDISGLALGTY
jgi:DNA relaxase NicK